MKSVGFFLVGVTAGVVVGLLIGPASETSCCRRVNAGIRDKAGDYLGKTGQAVGDVLGLWDRGAAFIDAIGVPHDV